VRATESYLDRIVPAVLRRLEERRGRLPLAELEAMDSPGPRPSFAAAVGAAGVSLIAEVKRASPSRGSIRTDLVVADLVAAYEAAGARAVSVLTEEDFFLGGLDDLRTAAEHTRLPLLRKDFIVDEYQLHEARVWGASAVLLIAALLDDRRLQELAGLSQGLGLDVLLEVHDAEEMERALSVGGAVLGINNRDLRTFEVSLETTERLAGLAPAGRMLVSESGIRTREDVQRLAAAGVDAVLVGESLVVGEDPQVSIRVLMGG
jgi:indole-3-glycerol phosphate synthase